MELFSYTHLYIEECFQHAPGCTLISEWVQPNTYTQHPWTPRVDCDPRRAYLGCLSLDLLQFWFLLFHLLIRV